MNKAEEIFKAWRTAFNPNEAQKELASLRMDICNGCEHKQVIAIIRCGLCGCPLAGKTYSPVQNACPAGKWGEVDKHFFELNTEYTKKLKQ
jgi:hypothetical protein